MLVLTLTHVASQSVARPPWTMVTMTSNVPFLAVFDQVISYHADPGNSNGSIWLHMSGTSRNDVWSSIDLGTTWELRSGYYDGRHTSIFPAASYGTLKSFSGCSDPNTNLNVHIGGYRFTSSNYSNEVWISMNHTHWYQQPASALPLQVFARSCVFTNTGDVIALGTNSNDNHVEKYVWRGRGLGSENDWQLVGIAPWSEKWNLRDLVIAQMPIGEVIYVLGGQGANGSVTNDVWASIDQGESWTPLILDGGRNPHPATIPSVRSFAPHRTWHSVKVTSNGVILLFGGTDFFHTLRDLWMSFDGGYNFVECAVEESNPSYFMQGQGAVLTSAGELILVGGTWYDPIPEIFQNFRVTKTPFSLNNSTFLAQMCGTQLPADGVGLRRWPIAMNSSISASSHVGVQWSYLIIVILVILLQNLLIVW